MDKKISRPRSQKKSFGAKVIITMKNGKKYTEQLERADAHPYGARPFKRNNYINKFNILTDKIRIVPPNILQQIIDIFRRKNDFSAIERIFLHLDPRCVDHGSVINQLKEMKLYVSIGLLTLYIICMNLQTRIIINRLIKKPIM